MSKETLVEYFRSEQSSFEIDFECDNPINKLNDFVENNINN